MDFDLISNDAASRGAPMAPLALPDAAPEECFDRLTRLAAAALDAPVALISLFDGERHWFKSRAGRALSEPVDSVALCSHVIATRKPLVVEDATVDERFAAKALVQSPPALRFYAGHPVFSANGLAIGTLCIAGAEARTLDEAGQRLLYDLAQLVEDEVNKACVIAARDKAELALYTLNEQLETRIAERTASLRAASRDLEQKQEMLDAILETVDVGVVACAADGALTLFNRSARAFHGLEAEELAPADWAGHYDLFAADGVTRMAPESVPLWRALRGETVKDAAMVIAPRGRRQRTLLASGRPLFGRSGEPLGAVVAMKDITDLNESQRRLQENEERLRGITENLPAVIGQIDEHGCFSFLNSHAANFLGQRVEQVLGKPMTSIYSEAEMARLAPHMAAAQAGRRVFFEDEVTKDGERVCYQASYIPAIDANGERKGFYAMAFDITARKNSELRQHESEERLRTITDNLPVLISYLDNTLTYRFANACYHSWHGVTPEQMLGKTVEAVFGAEFFGQREAEFRRCLQGHTVHLEREVGERRVHSTYMPHLRDGEVVGAYLLSTDVTATRQHEAQLRALANTDSLTGLPNRRHYETELAMAIERSRRNQRGLALMFLDVDHFKRINDTFGHAGGDGVLKEFARRLKCAVRLTDTVCRLAGDEFTIVLEGLRTREECARIGDCILDVMRAPFTVGGERWQVSTSIGIAWANGADTQPQQLTARADAALYAAKEHGRNGYQIDGVKPPRALLCA